MNLADLKSKATLSELCLIERVEKLLQEECDKEATKRIATAAHQFILKSHQMGGSHNRSVPEVFKEFFSYLNATPRHTPDP